MIIVVLLRKCGVQYDDEMSSKEKIERDLHLICVFSNFVHKWRLGQQYTLFTMFIRQSWYLS